MRVLVTGGAGFVGSNLVHALAARGDSVRIFDDFSTGRRENLAGLGADVEIVRGDVRDADAVRRAMQGIETVLHEAALPSVQRSLEDPLASHRSNADGTLNVLMAARDAGAQRVVYASSSSVYGNSSVLPKREDQAPMPASPYAVAKLAGEHYTLAFSRCFGLATVALRYFNVFGPRQDPNSAYAAVIPRFVHAALRGTSPLIFGDGTQTRDFTFIDNVVDANLRALTSEEARGQVLNVAAGVRVSLIDLLALLGKIVGRPLRAEHVPPRGGEVKDSQADIAAAGKALGYEPHIELEEGLRRTVAWYKAAAKRN